MRDTLTLQLYRPNTHVRTPTVAADVWDIVAVATWLGLLALVGYVLVVGTFL